MKTYEELKKIRELHDTYDKHNYFKGTFVSLVCLVCGKGWDKNCHETSLFNNIEADVLDLIKLDKVLTSTAFYYLTNKNRVDELYELAKKEKLLILGSEYIYETFLKMDIPFKFPRLIELLDIAYKLGKKKNIEDYVSEKVYLDNSYLHKFEKIIEGNLESKSYICRCNLGVNRIKKFLEHPKVYFHAVGTDEFLRAVYKENPDALAYLFGKAKILAMFQLPDSTIQKMIELQPEIEPHVKQFLNTSLPEIERIKALNAIINIETEEETNLRLNGYYIYKIMGDEVFGLKRRDSRYAYKINNSCIKYYETANFCYY